MMPNYSGRPGLPWWDLTLCHDPCHIRKVTSKPCTSHGSESCMTDPCLFRALSRTSCATDINFVLVPPQAWDEHISRMLPLQGSAWKVKTVQLQNSAPDSRSYSGTEMWDRAAGTSTAGDVSSPRYLWLIRRTEVIPCSKDWEIRRVKPISL